MKKYKILIFFMVILNSIILLNLINCAGGSKYDEVVVFIQFSAFKQENKNDLYSKVINPLMAYFFEHKEVTLTIFPITDKSDFCAPIFSRHKGQYTRFSIQEIQNIKTRIKQNIEGLLSQEIANTDIVGTIPTLNSYIQDTGRKYLVIYYSDMIQVTEDVDFSDLEKTEKNFEYFKENYMQMVPIVENIQNLSEMVVGINLLESKRSSKMQDILLFWEKDFFKKYLKATEYSFSTKSFDEFIKNFY